MLICSNKECEDNNKENRFFGLAVVFSSDRELAENINKVEAFEFQCIHCGNEAEEKEIK